LHQDTPGEPVLLHCVNFDFKPESNEAKLKQPASKARSLTVDPQFNVSHIEQ
jgi:hypothetical protein